MFDRIPQIILDKLDPDKQLSLEPFPHIVIENVLTKDEINSVRSQRDNLKVKKDNFYGGYRTDYSIPEQDYTDMFAKLCDVFGLQEFKNETVKANAVLSIYHQDKMANQVSNYVPLGPHRDREQKMFICLLYLCEEGDTMGGDLLLYKASPSDAKHRKDGIELSKVVPYAPGTLVIFPNGSTSIHAVGDRRDGPFDRAMVCITFDCFSAEWIARVVSIEKSNEYKRKFYK
jgi:hypothetical protein